MKNCIAIFPSFASLSSLTSLKLTRILVICFDRNRHLTLKFPVLRSLEIEGGRTWSIIKSVTFHVPLLEVCSMDYGTCVRSNAKLKICASRLAKFCYTGSFQSEIILLEAVHIASANIMLYGSSRRTEETMHFVSKLLSINAASLKLCLRSRKVLERVKLSFNDIPDFQILGHLDLDFATGEFLSGMLSRSPCLETLVLKDFCDTRLNSTFMPDCFLFTLKVVKFERFAGTKHELNFAKLVMNNAQALERITFSCCPKLLGQKKWENVKDNISSFKSTFSSVVIEFLS